ncbi:MAG: DUF2520 domain-containing protein [Salinivirgaceae bacterium]|nr:DUF2520 domain-containing protein [Salinivirgaceae bacterium]
MRIFIIGTGNVATHLSAALLKAGHDIEGVCGRDFSHTEELTKKLNVKPFSSIGSIPADAEAYLISVSDDNIADVVAQMPDVEGIVAHTAGSVPMSALARFGNHGVLYPLQSFSKSRTIDMSRVPLCIEGSNSNTAGTLTALARTLSYDVRLMTTEQRAHLHLAAVFASNFANCMYAEAENILKESNISFDIMRELIAETAAKAADMSPTAAQTGPARRGDNKVMSRQLELLPDIGLQKMYSFVSGRIQDRYKPTDK